jgi:Ca2+-dependent lipid-binding protein
MMYINVCIQATLPAPVQCHSLSLDIPIQADIDKILIEYQHHALHLRCGSSLPEHTLQYDHSTYDERTQINVISKSIPFTREKENMLLSSMSNGVRNIYTCIYIYNKCIYVHIFIYVCIYLYIYIYMYLSIYMFIHIFNLQ